MQVIVEDNNNNLIELVTYNSAHPQKGKRKKEKKKKKKNDVSHSISINLDEAHTPKLVYLIYLRDEHKKHITWMRLKDNIY
jgi:hypothetical protein